MKYRDIHELVEKQETVLHKDVNIENQRMPVSVSSLEFSMNWIRISWNNGSFLHEGGNKLLHSGRERYFFIRDFVVVVIHFLPLESFFIRKIGLSYL